MSFRFERFPVDLHASGAEVRSRSGKLCRTRPGVWFTDGWKQARAGGLLHRATDVFGPYQAPIKAGVCGHVRSCGESPKGGLHYFIETDGGWTVYYAHLSTMTLTVGEHVSPTTFLGGLGRSGNAEGTCPHLHVSLRDPKGIRRNPYRYLVDALKREGGAVESDGCDCTGCAA